MHKKIKLPLRKTTSKPIFALKLVLRSLASLVLKANIEETGMRRASVKLIVSCPLGKL